MLLLLLHLLLLLLLGRGPLVLLEQRPLLASGGLAEPRARLLPLALGAPQLPVLHAVHLAALLGVAARPP